MAKSKVTYHDANTAKLVAYCELNDYEFEWKSLHQMRIYTGVVIVDIYPSRMVYNVLNIDGAEQRAHFMSDMDQQFNLTQVSNLLSKGKI